MKSKYWMWIGLLILGLSAVVFGARSINDPNELARPVVITESNAWADGGSVEIYLMGSDGKKLSIYRKGSLDVERSRQPVYLINHIFGVIPYRRLVERQSLLAKQSKDLLESWLSGKLSADQRAKLLANDLTPLQVLPKEVATVFELAYSLEVRDRMPVKTP